MKPPYFRQPGLRSNDFVAVCLRVIVPRTEVDSLEEKVVRNAVETERAIGAESISIDALRPVEWDWLMEVLDLSDDA